MIYDLSSQIDRKRAEKRFVQLMGEEVKIELKKKQKRSIRQNSYLHLLIGYFAIETGYTTVEAKQIYKNCSPEIFEYENKGVNFIRSSADLSTTDMSKSIDKFRDMSSSEAGVYLPEANEDKFLDEIEAELQRNR
jgi:hypothetical protein